jgi:hypothetical protein
MKNILSQFNFDRYTDKDKHKWYPHIRRDCAVVFLCGALLSVSALFFHLFLYLQMKVDGFFSQPPSVQASASGSINKKGLADVLADFAAKKERFDKIVSEPVVIADPSTGLVSSSESKPPISVKKSVKTFLSQ